MNKELEYDFGLALQALVATLIKNAQHVPESVLKSALEFEASAWDKRASADKLTRLKAIAEATEPPSAINRFMESYPHPFSKKRYQEYLELMQLYRQSLAP